ncbi:metallophosphoesterase [Paenibacillus sp. M1]|uniref:Metallophosphoesterase n=1 Tax=Paenibacillus haidiansis TaxID=1574488 RepID=A0ABU7VMS0_9BACL
MANIQNIPIGEQLRASNPKINQNFQNLNNETTANKNNLEAHKSSTTAHAAQNITYSGEAVGANVKAAIDYTNDRIDNLIITSGDSSPEVADARGGYPVLGDRLNAFDEQLADLEQEIDQQITSAISDLQNEIDDANTQISANTSAIALTQRYKLTQDDGTAHPTNGSTATSGGTYTGDILELPPGYHNFNVTGGQTANLPPAVGDGQTVNVQIHVRPGVFGRKTIDFIFGYDNRQFRGVVHGADGSNFRGWVEVGGTTGTITNDDIVVQLQSDMALRLTKTEAQTNYQTILTQNDGKGRRISSLNPVPTSFLQLNKVGFWYLTTAENNAMTDASTLPPRLQNRGIWVIIPAYDHSSGFVQIIMVSSAANPCIAWRNIFTDGTYGQFTEIADATQLRKLLVAPDHFSNSFLSFSEGVKELQTPDTLTFGYITDTHYATYATNRLTQKQASLQHLKNISDLQKYISFDFKVHGGDIVDGDQAKAGNAADITNAMRLFFDDSCPSFVCKGNHDDGSWYASEHGNLLSDVINPNEMYARIVKPTEKYDIEQDGSNRSLGYYYYDIARHKARVIILNSSDNPYIANPDGTNKYVSQNKSAFRQDQISWFANEALATPAGWRVIIFMHHPINGIFGSVDQINGEAIKGLIEAYKNGSSYQGSGTITDYVYNINKTFSTPGDVIAVISGHIHYDASITINGVLYVSCLCSAAFKDNDQSPTRTVNTLSEEALDVFVVDFNSRTLYDKRFGAGSDRQFSF